MKTMFKWEDPQTGVSVIARYTTVGHYENHLRRDPLCVTGMHDFHYVLCVTQWGLDCQRDIVVAECKKCTECWAYLIEAFDDPEIVEKSGRELGPGTPV